ncbi:hypothetical protein PPYR_08354 [Photinus pyralis]|uniref:long-chain-fatty-acid--CoA ligase n=1 Tax=Photinus pyralis TaxID=7054 RepID=A0A5N4AJ31_PHOPY|nr:long-chain fatty acid transport protein 1 [Photinus pyralis]KAB0797360.1 hypothetical protein PPYR_08354 [Photinus pyralis]
MTNVENGNSKVHGLRITDLTDLESGGKVAGAENTTDAITLRRRKFRVRRPLYVSLLRAAIMILILSGLVAFAALLWIYLGWMFVLQLLIVIVIVYFLFTKKYKWFYVAAMTAPRDLFALMGYIKILLYMRRQNKNNNTVADVFREYVAKHPNKTAIIFEDEEWTFEEVEEYSNKIANIFKSHGYKKGDVVALFLENKPEFVCIWLGLSKLGVVVPLINTNQRLSPLVHSVTVSKSQAVIFGTELSYAVSEILDKIESSVALYEVSSGSSKHLTDSTDQRFQNLNVLLKEAPSTPPVISEECSHHDSLLYIYTSGTTGLPKAAVISNSRYIFIVVGIHYVGGFRSSDRFYTSLPLYHTAGGCMAMGQMLLFGCTIVLRKKFSASSYFTDCKKYNCTVAQYIGEMCRYILAVPPKPSDTDHSVRLIFGNGLRPQIWTEFVERFHISNVSEFYGATEGNANIVNTDNTVGAIGFVSRIIPQIYPIAIIKVDETTGEPIRNSKGFCIACKPNEPGAFIGKITSNPSRAFLGYVDKAASEKKIIHNVFKKGESAFLSGDIITSDEFGYLFFKDRTGDTFRWKGENVSTSEVEAVMSNVTAYRDVVVYGVQIQGQEGRAGMAAILDPEHTLDINKLPNEISHVLPTYARPIFVRILGKMDMTGTFKLKKNDLQIQGFDPTATSDSIYYLNNGQYTLLNKESYEDINRGKIRL